MMVLVMTKFLNHTQIAASYAIAPGITASLTTSEVDVLHTAGGTDEDQEWNSLVKTFLSKLVLMMYKREAWIIQASLFFNGNILICASFLLIGFYLVCRLF